MSEQLTPTQRVYYFPTQPCGEADAAWREFALEIATELERVQAELKEALLPRIEEVQIHAVTAERDQLKRQVEELKRENKEIISLRGLELVAELRAQNAELLEKVKSLEELYEANHG